MYQSKSNGEFDGAELLLYEEVARMPPFRRKTLALVGPRGVGRRTLKNRLINSDPEKFGTIVPCKNCLIRVSSIDVGNLIIILSEHDFFRRHVETA